MNIFQVQQLQKAWYFIQSDKYAEGLAMYAKLYKEYPECGGEYGRAAVHAGDFEMAVRIWEQIRKQDPDNVDYIVWLAGEYGKMGLNSRSRSLLSKAVKLGPRNLDAHIKHAWVFARTNSIDEARASVGKCLEIDPKNEEALYLSATLDRREENLAAAEQKLRDLLATGSAKPHVRYACHSELAQLLERTGRFDEAITTLNTAKDELRNTSAPPPGHERFLDRDKEVQRATALPKDILETWSKSFPAESRSKAQPLIFLTGSARSGTTLLERILDANPSLAAFDESFAFERIHRTIDVNGTLAPTDLNRWRERYLKNLVADLMTAVGSDKTLLDKNPSQTFWLPAFLRVFPELRVLVGLRDPRDIMISLYFQDHPSTNRLTFEQLAQHYRAVMDVWLALRQWDGLAWMETRYEDIVIDLEKEGRRVTQFIGLEWHENQVRYHEKNREKPILSNNYSDVTKPVYTRSVGRWKAYEKHLSPVLPLLEPYCKEFGYS